MPTAIYYKFLTTLPALKDKVIAHYQGNLSALVLFGSSARGDLTTCSDIDLFVLIRQSDLRLRERIEDFYQNIGDYFGTEEIEHLLSPLILTISEAQRLHPLYLATSDSHKVLYDVDGFFALILKRIENFKATGSIKQFALNGNTYWRLNL